MPDVDSIPSPELVAEALASDTPDILSNLTKEEADIAAKIMPALAEQANRTAEANKAKELDAVLSQLRLDNQKMITEKIAELEAQAKPPDPKELEKILAQEYLEFKVKVYERGSEKEREFVIRELPQVIELKFFRSLQKSLLPHLQAISSLDFSAGDTQAGQIKKVLEMVPELMEVLAEVCAWCLDPFGAGGLDKTWVQNNMSSNRILSVIGAQVIANRFRDFFLASSSLIRR